MGLIVRKMHEGESNFVCRMEQRSVFVGKRLLARKYTQEASRF